MTKYLLEGGNYKKSPALLKAFFAEALKDLGSSPTILWCMFAAEPENRHQRFQQFMDIAQDVYPAGVEPIHVEAVYEDFARQVSEADLINIQGGHTDTLQKALVHFDLPELFKGKVIGGHSAGAHILSTSHWSPGLRAFGEGFGLLPIKTLTHYNSDYGSDDPRGPINWDVAKAELEEYGDTSLPVYALREGEFVVIEK